MMNPSEMLRKLADIIDSMGMSNPQASTQHNPGPVNGLKQVDVDNVDQSDDKVMIPPLQQKMELLKKVTGVDNAYDEQPAEPSCAAGAEDEEEMSILKRNAGIQPVAIQVASEDNDITG